MKFIKQSERQNPKVSLVLLDWSVRESFHLFHYLSKQTVPRDDFEVIVIENYSRVSDAIREFEDQVDTWITLGMPEDCYYHKHLMYNVGIALSRGGIVMIGDSDAMVKETFIETIIKAFEDDPEIAFHMDQFRNNRRDLYPFSYPSFEEVLGEGCTNNKGGKTAGVLDNKNPIHTRNYGACMCARRDDLIAIGGADEHIDYLGHICGPYDMTFRLVNHGRREVWHRHEFMYHTWHPGQAGADNYMGPHDGKHMSTTALEALTTGRVEPLQENTVIRALRQGETLSTDEIAKRVIDPNYLSEWKTARMDEMASHQQWTDYAVPMGHYNGFRIAAEIDRLIARPVDGIPVPGDTRKGKDDFIEAADLLVLREKIDRLHTPELIKAISRASRNFAPFVIIGWVKELIRNVLAHGYRAAKFHDRKSLFAFAKVAAKLPRDLFRAPQALRDAVGGTRGTHGSLAAAVYYGAAPRGLNLSKDAVPIILINNTLTARFLKELRREKGLNGFDFLMVGDGPSIDSALRRIERESRQGPIIIWGDLYTQFHATFAASPLAGQTLIV